MGAVPLVPRSTRGHQVLPGHPRSRRALARRLYGYPEPCRKPGKWTGCRHRPWSSCQCCPVDRRVADSAEIERPAQETAETPPAQARPRSAGVEPTRQSEAGHSPAASPRGRCPQGLGGEDLYRYRAQVRRGQSRESPAQSYDALGQGHDSESWQECPPESRAQPRDHGIWLGAADTPTGGQGPRPGGEDKSRVHQSAMLGVRARGCEVAREPSVLRVHGLRFRLQR